MTVPAAVRATLADTHNPELGIVIETNASEAKNAARLARLLARYMFHFGYPGRKTTAGNIACPMSPSLINFKREDGQYGTIVLSVVQALGIATSFPVARS